MALVINQTLHPMLYYLFYMKNTFKRHVILGNHEVITFTIWTFDPGNTRPTDQRHFIAAPAEPTCIVPCGDSNSFLSIEKNQVKLSLFLNHASFLSV